MGFALKKPVSEQVDDLVEALVPEYDEARVRAALEVLRQFAAIDPRCAFGHSVGEQIVQLDRLDQQLCMLNRLTSRISASARLIDRQLWCEVDAASAQASMTLRTFRSLAARLSGDDSDNDAEVSADVDRLLRERAAATESQWSDEERRAFSPTAPRASEDFEAWLNDS